MRKVYQEEIIRIESFWIKENGTPGRVYTGVPKIANEIATIFEL